MHRPGQRFISVCAAAALAAGMACTDQPVAPKISNVVANRRASSTSGGVYTMTNATSGNSVVAFSRGADGSLSPVGEFATGGLGVGGTVDPLQSQYSILLDDGEADGHRALFVVNAGSNDVSAFHVADDASLRLISRVPSGGARPVSLAITRNLLYVLNAGDNSVSGFRVTDNGALIPMPHSTRSLSAGAAGASTIHFSADGGLLIVTERDANRLETFTVQPDGRLGDPVVTPSNGAVPFGFDVTPSSQVIVSEAAGAAPDGAVSSYAVTTTGALSVITGSLDDGGAAACWLLLTADGHIGFVSTAGSNTIASIGVADDGSVTLLNAQAASTGTGTTPIDLDLAAGDRFLYVLEGGSGNIATFDVGAGGTLSAHPVTPAGAAASGLQGMAAF
ncbi:MAG TPA: beta-propeller fold lactonase family protein [Gemmatimonadaceae bacterium]|nr:beta-propeller fold lactonase family protein [Gemmatimonadaceae bacterium]